MFDASAYEDLEFDRVEIQVHSMSNEIKYGYMPRSIKGVDVNSLAIRYVMSVPKSGDAPYFYVPHDQHPFEMNHDVPAVSFDDERDVKMFVFDAIRRGLRTIEESM